MAYSGSYRPRFAVECGVVGVATGLYLALMFYPMTQANFPDVGLLAGVPVGVVVGVLTPPGGDEMNNTLVACGAGATLVIAASAAYGSYVSWLGPRSTRYLSASSPSTGSSTAGSSFPSITWSRSRSPSSSVRAGPAPRRGSTDSILHGERFRRERVWTRLCALFVATRMAGLETRANLVGKGSRKRYDVAPWEAFSYK